MENILSMSTSGMRRQTARLYYKKEIPTQATKIQPETIISKQGY
jgi:hypothetical protein